MKLISNILTLDGIVVLLAMKIINYLFFDSSYKMDFEILNTLIFNSLLLISAYFVRTSLVIKKNFIIGLFDLFIVAIHTHLIILYILTDIFSGYITFSVFLILINGLVNSFFLLYFFFISDWTLMFKK